METLSPEVLDELRHGRAPRERKMAVCTTGAHLAPVDRAEILCVLSEDPDEMISTRAQEAMLSIAPEIFVEAVKRGYFSPCAFFLHCEENPAHARNRRGNGRQ